MLAETQLFCLPISMVRYPSSDSVPYWKQTKILNIEIRHRLHPLPCHAFIDKYPEQVDELVKYWHWKAWHLSYILYCKLNHVSTNKTCLGPVQQSLLWSYSWEVFLLEKKWQKNSCSTDNSTSCFMASALNSPTLMSLFTTGGITRFTEGTTFLW